MADALLHLFFSSCVGGFVFVFVLPLLVRNFSFIAGLGKTVSCDCDISWVFLHIFYL